MRTRSVGSILATALLVLVIAMGALPMVAAWNGGHDALGAPGTATAWFFAEGTTRAGFSEFLCILNPGEIATKANVSYMLGTGQNIEKTYDLPAKSRVTVNVNNDVPPESDVSVKITSPDGIVAERPMYFNYKGAWSGGHDVLGAQEPHPLWYFAEGTTRAGFDTYLCLANPNENESTVNLDYFCGDGQKVTKAGIKIAPRSRMTVAVHEDALGIGRHDDAHGDFSVRVESSRGAPVVAERSSYFAYKPYLTGGHDVLGAIEPSKTWYFAEGCTREGFDTFLCLENPHGRDAVLDITYYCADGVPENRTGITVPAEGRFTIPVHESPLGIGRQNNAHGDFSIKVESRNGVSVVAERPMYFSYRPFWTGGHDTVGTSEPSDTWYFAEGCTRDGFDTYLCLADPGDADALVDITYFCSDGRLEERKGVRIPGRSRLTVTTTDPGMGVGRFNDNHGDFSIKVSSTNGVPVVAERSVYFASRWRTIDRNALASAWHWGEVVRGNASKNQMALTFDIEGSGPQARAILDILKQKGVEATLFVLGGFAAGHPDVIVRMADEGHEIGNHSYSHPWFSRISDAQLVSELAGTEAQINLASGYTTKPYFRFPNGDRNGGLISRVNAQGYLSVYWTIDPQEWRTTATVESVHSVVVGQASSGAIVLMHDRDRTVQALPWIIDDLRARGFELVTLSQALSPGP